MNKINQLKRTIGSIVKEQAIKRPQVDLSTKPKTLTSWLQSHFNEINKNKIYYDPEKLIDYIKDAKNDGIYVSPQYLDKMATTIKKLKYPDRILKHLYDMYLSGSGMAVTENKKRKNDK